MKQALPEHSFIPLDVSHPVFQSFFGIKHLNVPHPTVNVPPSFLAMFENNDPSGRMIALANWNNDLGDYWEWSAEGLYGSDPTNDAYRLGIAEKLSSRGVIYSVPRGVSELSLSELAALRQEYDADGFSQKAATVARAYHMRFALPVATFVLSLLALGICDTLRGRTSRFLAVIAALALYWAALAVSEWSPLVPAVVSVWAPNIVFAAMAFSFLKASA